MARKSGPRSTCRPSGGGSAAWTFLTRLVNHRVAASVVSSQRSILKPLASSSRRSSSGGTRKPAPGGRAPGAGEGAGPAGGGGGGGGGGEGGGGGGGGGGPRDGKRHGAGGAGEDVVERERPAGPQHAVHPPVERRLVRDVHRGMLGPDDVEGAVREGQVQRIALPVRHQVREPGALREHRRHAAVLVGQVDARDPAAERAGDAARRPPDAAPDVEDARARGEPGGARQLDRRHPAARGELAD